MWDKEFETNDASGPGLREVAVYAATFEELGPELVESQPKDLPA